MEAECCDLSVVQGAGKGHAEVGDGEEIQQQ